MKRRIEIKDLPKDKKISKKEMKNLFGGPHFNTMDTVGCLYQPDDSYTKQAMETNFKGMTENESTR